MNIDKVKNGYRKPELWIAGSDSELMLCMSLPPIPEEQEEW